MSCKPTYKGVRYNSLEELYNANGVNEQQKQQAQQLYSQYLDTIFPDSKVKDIVYHGTLPQNKFEKFDKQKGTNLSGEYGEIHFGDLTTAKERPTKVVQAENFLLGVEEDLANFKPNIIPVILNISNIKRVEEGKNWGQGDWNKLISKEQEADAFIYSNKIENKGKDSYVVFEPEQIHILGSKQDIEGFKEFVTQPTTQSVKSGVSELFESNTELAAIGTPEQYSQYLDTIFPSSKVKDIVYHGSSYGKKENFNSNTNLPYGDRHRVIFFATNINQALAFSDYDKSKITSALININNPFDYNSFSDELRQDLIKEEYNRIIETLGSNEIEYADKVSKKFPDVFKTKIWDLFTGRKFLSKIYQKYNIDSWFEVQGNIEGHPYENVAVFDPEQIHILGSKQDIEGFKNYVNNLKQTKFASLLSLEKDVNNEEINAGFSHFDTGKRKLLVDNLQNRQKYSKLVKEYNNRKTPFSANLIDVTGNIGTKHSFIAIKLKARVNIQDLITSNQITYTTEDGQPCAKEGVRFNSFTPGSNWQVVKDLKGYPSHTNGGIDVKIDQSGVKIINNKGDLIKAENGLVLPNLNQIEVVNDFKATPSKQKVDPNYNIPTKLRNKEVIINNSKSKASDAQRKLRNNIKTIQSLLNSLDNE